MSDQEEKKTEDSVKNNETEKATKSKASKSSEVETEVPAMVKKQLEDNKNEIEKLTDQVSKLKKENESLLNDLDSKSDEFNKLSKEHERSGNLLTEGANRETSLINELETVKSEFENYKQMHDQVIQETNDLTVQKRQEVQGLIQKRALVKEEAVKFMKFLEETLK